MHICSHIRKFAYNNQSISVPLQTLDLTKSWQCKNETYTLMTSEETLLIGTPDHWEDNQTV